MSTKKYTIIIESFAKSHYLKKMRKKYKKSFDAPWKAFEFMLQKFDLMIERDSTSSVVYIDDDNDICKTGFKIAKNESIKSSGNRCIIARNIVKKEIRVLLIYHKNNVQGSNETQWWKKKIKDNYVEYKDYL